MWLGSLRHDRLVSLGSLAEPNWQEGKAASLTATDITRISDFWTPRCPRGLYLGLGRRTMPTRARGKARYPMVYTGQIGRARSKPMKLKAVVNQAEEG